MVEPNKEDQKNKEKIKEKKLFHNIFLAWISRCYSTINETANIKQLGHSLCQTFVNLIRIQFPVS